jgi:hypothetical protein
MKTYKIIIIFACLSWIVMMVFAISSPIESENKTHVYTKTSVENSLNPIKTSFKPKISIAPSVNLSPKQSIKNETLADKAYKKLYKENMIDEEYIIAMNVLIKLDDTVAPIKEIKSDSLFNVCWQQTFEFSDGSKIELTKKQDENKNFIFVPFETKIIEEDF